MRASPPSPRWALAGYGWESPGARCLHGSVTGMGALRCAEANAELTPGVVLVIDNLVLLPGPPTTRCLAPRQWGSRG
jgi:hypothetical protein